MLGRVAKNPISAAPIIMKAFSFKKQSKADQFEFQDENYMSRGSPELTPEDAHVWVTAPFLAFDSFDMWHGAAKWDGDAKGDLCNAAQDVMRARQRGVQGPSQHGTSISSQVQAGGVGGTRGVPFSPLTSAYRGERSRLIPCARVEGSTTSRRASSKSDRRAA